MVYWDCASTTPVLHQVVEAMTPFFADCFGNTGSLHMLGEQAREAVDNARGEVANMLGCKSRNIVFTSGGSESNSLAIDGLRQYMKDSGKTIVVVSKVEHPSLLNAVKGLANCGFTVKYLPVHKRGALRGTVDFSSLDSLPADKIGLVSVMAVNNELGTRNDIESIGQWCKERQVLFHTDAVQMTEEIPNVEAIQCDLLSISGHKFGAPKGIGALYVRDRKLLTPIIHGSDSQEFGLRGGTLSVPLVVGLGEACSLRKRFSDINASIFRRGNLTCRSFLKMLELELSKKGHAGIMKVNAEPSEGSHIRSVQFDGVDAESLVLALSQHRIYISAQSACHSREHKPSHVLEALGLSEKAARQTVRFSLAIDELPNSGELAEVVSVVAASVCLLREFGSTEK